MFFRIKAQMGTTLLAATGKRVLNPVAALPLLLLLVTVPAQAVTNFQVDVQATYTGSNSRVLTVIPAGTLVTGSVQINVTPGTPLAASISGASGTFNWDNGGPQVFNVSRASGAGLGAGGFMPINFFGTGPSIGGFTPTPFVIHFNLPTNPFRTARELSDLMAASSVIGLRVGAKNDRSGVIIFDTVGSGNDVSGSVWLIPEPLTTTLSLMGLGMLAITTRRRVPPSQRQQLTTPGSV